MGAITSPYSKANFVRHAPCDVCGSSDANGVYDDGHTYCFSCETHQPSSEGSDAAAQQVQDTGSHKQKDLLKGEAKALEARGLTEADCAKFSYWIGQNQKGDLVQIANYRDAFGKLVAQKVRGRDKSFQFIGDTAQATLFGSHLWSTGRKLCLTEGELDAIDRKTNKRNLSVARAKFVYDFLLKRGIKKSRMSYEGMAHKFPLGGSEDKDRRVEILILSE